MARLQAQSKSKQWRRTGLGGLVLALLGTFLVLQQAVALTGSSFEILDGNEKVDDAAKLDWASAEVVAGQTILPDETQTSTDESISGSEDDTTVTLTAGSIQPNKSDITQVRKFTKKEGATDFLYLAFDRFLTTNGVMAIDFELNQKAQPPVPATGGTWNLNRTVKDKLLVFEMVNGGTVPIISMMSWVTGADDDCEKNGQVAPCWGTAQELTPDTDPAAEGSVNQTGDIVFGEMAINLQEAGIFEEDVCTSFASLYAKSRSSGSSLANQISDLVKPKNTIVSNCGSVTVEKKVTGPTVAGDDASFTFNVSCPAADLDPVTGGKQTTLQFDLPHNGSRQINDVPVGSSCTVTEAAPSPDNFSTTYTVTGVAGTSSGREASVTNVPLTGKTVTFTNARQTGGLDITKTSTGGVGTFVFAVDCTGTAYDLTGADKVSITTATSGTSVTSDDITGIPTGTVCTVTEDANSLYSTVVTPSDGQRTINTTVQNVSFANTRKTAKLTVDKLTTGGTGTFLFAVDCDGTTYDRTGANKLSITTTGTAEVLAIPTGTSCTVTEDANALFTSSLRSPSASNTVTIADAGSTVYFQNVRKTGTLTVAKTTTGGTGTFRFEVDCSNNDFDRLGDNRLTIVGSGSATVENIPTGVTCTVTETSDPLFTSTRTPSDGQVTIDENGETVTFSNVRNTGTLTVSKTTTGGTGTFRFEVDCTDDRFDRFGDDRLTITDSGSATINGIPTGVTCTVTETANALFTSTRTPTNGTVVMDSNGETVSFTNVRKVGTLTVAKTTTGGTGTFRFAVDCSNDTFDRTGDARLTVVDSGTASIGNIPIGTTCTVTETDDARFTSTRTPANGAVTIDENGETVSFTNVRNTGTLTVAKTTTGGTGTFRFEVDCSDNAFDRLGDNRLTVVDSGSATVTNIPTGTTCTVTETVDPLFTSMRTPTNGQVVMDQDGESVSFTNVRKTSSLTITKATTGGDGGFDFAVDCSENAFDRTAVLITTANGGGSSPAIAGIPTGTTCTVTETVPVGWAAVGGVVRTVTVDLDGETAAFSNRKLPSGINVLKSASAPTVHNGAAVTYTYVVTNSGENPLTAVKVVDDKCAPVTGPSTGDTGADGVLGLTEIWTYSCTSTLTATTTNIATATGTDPLGANVTDTDTRTVAVINPRIAIDKTPSATSVTPGTTVVYTYTVTNPGDVPLATVAVVDDKCSPVTLVSGDVNVDGLLQVGEAWVFRCSQVQTGALDTLTNIGTASGTDPLGLVVKSTDTVTVSVVAPLVIAQPTAPAVVVPAPAPAPALVATAPVTLPRTGMDVNGWMQLGASLILLGISLLITASNRRRTA